MTDPIGDMVTRIRNADRVQHAEHVLALPALQVLGDRGDLLHTRAPVLELRYSVTITGVFRL